MGGCRVNILPLDDTMPGAMGAVSRGARIVVAHHILVLPLVLLAAAAFSPALSNGFLFDDDELILRNPFVTGGMSAENLRWAFSSFHGGNWIPLTWVSHQSDVMVWGLDPTGHHLTSVLLHGVNVALLFAVMRALTGSVWASVLLAVFFGMHPLRVESVVWVSERKDVLSMTFFLLGVGAWRRYAGSPGPGRLALVTALYACGLMAKPMLVTFPFVLLLLDWWPLGRWEGQRRRFGTLGAAGRLLVEKIPLLVLAGAASVLALIAQRSAGAMAPLQGVPLGARFGNALVSYARYLGKTAWPTDLSPIYQHAGRPVPAWQWAAALVFAAATTVAVVRRARRQPWLAAGWFWYLGTLVPVIGVVQVGVQSMADRYTYLPAVGLTLALVWCGADAVRGRPVAGRFAAAGSAAVIAALSLAAWSQSRVWRDGVTLFAHAVQVEPDNWLARNNLGKYLIERRRWAEADEEIHAALRLNPDNANAHYNMAAILAQAGRDREAIAEYREVLRLEPVFFEALREIGGLLNAAGTPAEAERYLGEAVRLRPGDARARLELGLAVRALGRAEDALRHFVAAQRLDPLQSDAPIAIGRTLTALGRDTEALPWLDLATQMRPGDAVAHCDRALALERLGRYADAEYSLRRSLGLDPGNAAARAALSRVAGRGGR